MKTFWIICLRINLYLPCYIEATRPVQTSLFFYRVFSVVSEKCSVKRSIFVSRTVTLRNRESYDLSFSIAMLIKNETPRLDVSSFHRSANVKEQGDWPAWIRFEADSFHLDSKFVIEVPFETCDVVSLFQVVRRSEDRTNILSRKHSYKVKDRCGVTRNGISTKYFIAP